MIIKNIFSLAASIISVHITILFFLINCNAEENNIKQYSNDEGVLSIMYHRFDENKYPSTNIRMEVFEKHIQLIKNQNYDFIQSKEFIEKFNVAKKQKKYF